MDSVPQLIRDALKVGIITHGGGGDNPRNVMASPLTGTAPDETFDVFPYAQAVGEYLLTEMPGLHMPRKLKVGFSNTKANEVHATFRDLGFVARENGTFSVYCLLTEMPGLHMPRKLKVGFSNTKANEVHATFRDLGFVARENGTFSVYCTGGLGPNPKLGVHITDNVDPSEVSLYVHAMIRLFTTYGNYESRAKSRTRYLQDTLGKEKIRSCFLQFVEDARKEMTPWPVEPSHPVSKSADGTLSDHLLTEKRVLAQKQNGLYSVSYPRKEMTPWPVEPSHPVSKSADGTLSDHLLTEKRVLAQKQNGLYSVSYHPLGGRLESRKPAELYAVIKEMPETELRISPDGTLYIINLTAKEVPAVLEATKDGAASLFESSISCIGVPICQHGLRNSYALLESCIQRVRKEQFADGVLPCIHISGCPSSCGSHQAGSIGFVGHSKRVDGKMEPAFKLFVNGCGEEPGSHLGIEKEVLLETVIPEFLVALGKKIAAADSTFDTWYPTHTEEFDELAAEYAEKTK